MNTTYRWNIEIDKRIFAEQKRKNKKNSAVHNLCRFPCWALEFWEAWKRWVSCFLFLIWSEAIAAFSPIPAAQVLRSSVIEHYAVFPWRRGSISNYGWPGEEKKSINMQTHVSTEKKWRKLFERVVKSAKLLCRFFCWLRIFSKNRSFCGLILLVCIK